MRIIVKLFFILSLSWISSTTAHAALSAADEIAQTQYLEALSIAWGETDPANRIFIKPEYNAADWDEFFNKFFNCSPSCAGNSSTRHAFTDDLSNYLQYPVFYWFGADVHLKLQTALVNPLWSKINDSVSPYPSTLGFAMANDVELRQSLFNSHRFFASLVQNGVVDTTVRTSIYNTYKSHIDQNLQYFSDARTMGNTQPWVASLRAQVWMSFGSTLPLTTALASDIATTISLRNQKLTIWNTYNVLIIDDNGLDTAQLSALSSLLGSIPASLNPLRYMTFSGFFDQNAGLVPGSWAVNSFTDKLNVLEQQFPSDIAANNPPPIFMSAAAHEINHIVDAYQATLNPTGWDQYKLRLLAQTGRDPMQLLRCGAGYPECAAYLVDNPQEFFAGMSNQYITDTWHTLDHALQRFNAGYKEPINQFLLFADVYTQALAATKVYAINSTGAVAVNDAAIGRDTNGRIVMIRRDDASNHATYQFTLDDIGNVTAYDAIYDAPTVGVATVSGITQTNATLTATVNTNGDPSGGAYAECKLATAPDSSYAIVSGSAVLFSAPVNGAVSVNMSGLTSNTPYSCRMAAWGNHTGNVPDTRGSAGNFTTLSYIPIAITDPATLVRKTTATLNGTCDFKGLPGTAWFEYWKSAKAPVIITTPAQSFAASPTPYKVTQAITGLSGATNYGYRVKCSNSFATTPGSPVPFKTTK